MITVQMSSLEQTLRHFSFTLCSVFVAAIFYAIHSMFVCMDHQFCSEAIGFCQGLLKTNLWSILLLVK